MPTSTQHPEEAAPTSTQHPEEAAPTSTQHPWEAERAVSPALARTLIAAAAPQLASASLEAFGAGWDNTAYLVGGRWLFRFPRRAVAVPLMENETRALPSLAPRLSLRVPNPVYVGRPSAEYPWPYAGYELLEGKVAALGEASAECAEENAEGLARFLAELHAQGPEDWPDGGIPGDLLRRLDPAHRIPLAHEKLEQLEGRGALKDLASFREILDTSLPQLPRAAASSLVHGDFDPRHLLLDEAGKVVAVIDWGDLHFGDPALDLAIAFTFVPPRLRARFRGAYGAISEATWAAARFRALHNSLHVLDWALDIGSHALEASARRWLGQLTPD